jgi:stalled ribosome rescue protein Dom34
MTVRHVAVWIDHKEAKIFHIEPEGFDVSKITAPHHHMTRPGEEQGHPRGADRFFHSVAEGLQDAEEVLVVGPSSAKLDFLRFVVKHEHALEPKILGLETLDHPTDGQIAAYVRHYFHGKDRSSGSSLEAAHCELPRALRGRVSGARTRGVGTGWS